MKLVTVEEMKRLEQLADAGGLSYAAMMESAGRSVAREIIARTPIQGQDVLVLVGPGNNGGDGLVAARYLCQAGAHVCCYLWQPRAEGDPNWRQVQELDIESLHAAEDADRQTLRERAGRAGVIVDALLGTGVSRPVEGELKEILGAVGQAVAVRQPTSRYEWTALLPGLSSATSGPSSSAPLVIAVDVPSGLNCDTGEIDPAALPANLTVTFGAPKRGHLSFPGAAAIGELIVADIGLDPVLSAAIPTEVATARRAGELLPARPLDAHKGTFGKAMIVAGSVNYSGAPYLAAAAAARVGAGLVTLAPPQPLYPVLAAKLTEATFFLLPHDMGVLVPGAVNVLVPQLATYQAMLLGPGLGREKETVAFVHQLLGIASPSEPRRIGFRHVDERPPEKPELPALVIDADGLNALAEAEDWWTYLPAHSILTPHPGEMTRLARQDVTAGNRVAMCRDKAKEWNQVVVLKGAYTVVAAPDGRASVIPFANPGLATAGTGDVLAGAIVGLLAQGSAPFDAALCGAYLHGLAGQIAAQAIDPHFPAAAGILASDLLPALPKAISDLR